MNREIALKICSDSEFTARDAIASVRGAPYSAELVLAVTLSLDNSSILSKRNQSKRLHALLTASEPEASDYDSLISLAREVSPHLRLTISNRLPSDIRQGVYGTVPNVAEGARESTLNAVGEVTLTSETEGRAVRSATSHQVSLSTVLLFSHPDSQDANKRLLESFGLGAILVTDLHSLTQMIAQDTGICGFIVDKSTLSLLDQSEQKRLFELLGAYSSFSAIRVHDDRLELTHEEVKSVITKARGLDSNLSADAISFQSDGRIRASEVGVFTKAAELLKTGKKAKIVFDDLTQEQKHLIAAAVNTRTNSNKQAGSSSKLSIRLLPSGLSGAKVVMVTAPNSQVFVGKLTDKACALDEIGRVSTYVQPWADYRPPEVFFHGGCAVILSNLVSDHGDPCLPAEQLQERLERLWNDQFMRVRDIDPEGEEANYVAKALVNTVAQLSHMNGRSPPANIPAFIDAPVTHFEQLESDGFELGLGEQAKKAFGIAGELYRRRKGLAVLHGDVHLRNILVRGDSDIQLIDFAATAPGHPAVDLVRFELALFAVPVRWFASEAEALEFQQAFTVDRRSLDTLRQQFPNFFALAINSVCCAGMVAARDTVIDVLRTYDADVRDYLAAKFLIACQAQTIIGYNQALCRSVINAIADELCQLTI